MKYFLLKFHEIQISKLSDNHALALGTPCSMRFRVLIKSRRTICLLSPSLYHFHIKLLLHVQSDLVYCLLAPTVNINSNLSPAVLNKTDKVKHYLLLWPGLLLFSYYQLVVYLLNNLVSSLIIGLDYIKIRSLE